MEEFVSYMIQNLVDEPNDVKVSVYKGEKSSILEIKVAENDVAKLVGRQGRTIKALRTIAMTVAARIGRKVRLEVIQ